jgi:hypothetical protein
LNNSSHHEWDTQQDDPRRKDLAKGVNHPRTIISRATSVRGTFLTAAPMKSSTRPGLTDAQLLTFQMSLKSLLDGLEDDNIDDDDDIDGAIH